MKIKRLLLSALLCCSLSCFAMTDQEVIAYVKSGIAAGKSQQQIGKELLAKGVTPEQAERIKASYEAQEGADKVVTTQNIAAARHEMALHDFRNLLEPLDRRLDHLRVLERDVDIGADVESHHLGVHDKAAAQNHARIGQLADSLMNRGARYAAFAGDFQKRHPRVGNQILEYPAVYGVQIGFRHGFLFIR